MNANEIALRSNALTNRIRRFIVALRTFFFISAIFTSCGGIAQIIWGFEGHFGNGYVLIPNGLITLTWSVLLWLAYRLFKLYAFGHLFSSEIAICIRHIGYISILLAFERLLTTAFLLIAPAHSSLPGMTWVAISLEFLINVSPGFAIIFIAWIMDEGRKIQEEQELTV